MKFIVSSTVLSGHLQAISRVINSKNSLPILDCFLFELQDGTLSVTVSDSETTMVTSLEVVESDADGRLAIAARTLLDALKEIPEQPLTFEIDLSTLELTVQYQNGKYCLVGQNADEFPTPARLSENVVRVEMDAQVLLGGINRALFATADDELRPVMNGVYFDITTEDITMVASDGHKLVRCKTFTAHGNERAAFILPKKPANLLKNLLPREQGNVVVEFDERNAAFTLSNHRMVCRLIEGRYPNYNAVIPPNSDKEATIDRQALLSAIRRVSVFAEKANRMVVMKFSGMSLLLTGHDFDNSTSAEETVFCAYQGGDIRIGFSAENLMLVLENTDAAEVRFRMSEPCRATIIEPTSEDGQTEHLALLMPMMLPE